MKNPGFYDNADLHIYLICLRQVVSSLTKIQYLNCMKKWKYDESMMVKIIDLYEFARWESAFDGL